MEKIEIKLKKILKRENKPLVGNNRSFSMCATKRKFQGNIQKFKIGKKTYKLRVKDFRSLRSY
ncbi:large ribosomal subunit protein bL28 [endosymbiont GvMRE of Glomus versiforme]|uniref:large ribosomal subunit protein bL28 n=1 Tax=endosymbiont GvMRE of Glomus versiforme TaxID=2039283 RepID=UPI000EC8F135|nr:50S ribosomal protein L28 [endosymbiont GvMRE of Glomus versiforme]RHZ37650.1 50S ribosomal protein L28 [endosymbiont GvMRE of Glomus versiforme]